MSLPDDSMFSLFISQPLVLWSFVLGILVLVTAVFLNIITQQRRKRAAAAIKAQRLNATTATPAETLSQELEAAVASLADLAETDLDSKPLAVIEEPDAETAVNPLTAIAEGAEEAEQMEAPEFTGVEVNSKLADLFQNDIIVDPRVQALRDSLDDVPMAALLAHLREVADRLNEHIPQPALEMKQ